MTRRFDGAGTAVSVTIEFPHKVVIWESSVPVVAVSPAVSVSEALARWRAGLAIDGVEVLRSGLLEVLASVPDPRAARGKRYPLVALLAIAILAVAAGMRGYAGFASWARTAPDEVLSQLGVRFRRPSEKTFRRVLSSLDAADLDRRLGGYFTALAAAAHPDPGGLVAVSLDGKTVRGAVRGTATGTHLVSVFAHHARLVLAQLAVAAKSNEIPCVRAVLKSLPRFPMMVIMDAMHTQIKTARLIRATLRSHYLLVVKSNQPGLLARIKALPWHDVPVNATDDDRGHGRVEKRTLQSLTAARGIGFPYAKQVIRITRDRLITATGRRGIEVVYAICSVAFEQAQPAAIATWLRQHWGIENSVHWVRDVTFDEDRSTVRTGSGPQVMATLRNTALNLHRLDGATNIAEACRETAFTPDRRINLLNPQNHRSHAC